MIHLRSARGGTDSPDTDRSGRGAVRTGLGAVLRGSGAVGLLLARSGFGLARAGVRAGKATEQQSAESDRPSGPGGHSPRIRIALAAGLLAVVLGGTAAAVRGRRTTNPEPAPEPPRLQPSMNGSAPHTPAGAPVIS